MQRKNAWTCIVILSSYWTMTSLSISLTRKLQCKELQKRTLNIVIWIFYRLLRLLLHPCLSGWSRLPAWRSIRVFERWLSLYSSFRDVGLSFCCRVAWSRSWRRRRCAPSSRTMRSCAASSPRRWCSTLCNASRLTAATSSTFTFCRRSCVPKASTSASARTWSCKRYEDGSRHPNSSSYPRRLEQRLAFFFRCY